ncbi:hypothetical protein DSCO28_66590 [Desulfosarcina ovata subsp. sediminis]|uniref:Uncharacterized protein n=2 Tax=Desulfosarcina ovata TaxID=83564 RepID=A0A5K8AKK8_9BACT|nr:hypothetical protein DSCO28_66590 [Desulfosarcina ovata subsp. sediminis]BBO93029.1 hypothetical protein DSCOOX_62090 [Desulfosarcina ovata subsp. ovata]
MGIIFLVAGLWQAMATASAIGPEEVHHYREITGKSVKTVEWRLSKGDPMILTYTSPGERYVTATGPDYDTRRWRVAADNGRTALIAERVGAAITIRGRFKGDTVNKVLAIDDAPWYQATSLSLRQLVASEAKEKCFWTIRIDTLSAHKIKAIKKGVENLNKNACQQSLMHIRLTLTGFLAPFWKSDYWFALPGGIFDRFKGPSGPPGSPMTTVTRMVACRDSP